MTSFLHVSTAIFAHSSLAMISNPLGGLLAISLIFTVARSTARSQLDLSQAGPLQNINVFVY